MSSMNVSVRSSFCASEIRLDAAALPGIYGGSPVRGSSGGQHIKGIFAGIVGASE